MEMEEILAGPFTTPTTCFSCSPCADTNRHVPIRFVTENHILGVVMAEGSYRPVTYSSVPRDKASVICVGMAQYPVPDSSEPLQALTFIDPLCIDQPEDTPLPLQHPTSSTRGIPDTSIRDDASIVSNTHSISIQDGSRTTRPQSRRPSFNTGPTISTAATTPTSTSNYSTISRTASENSMMRIPDISGSTRANTSHDPPILPPLGSSLVAPKARLILQGPSTLVQDSIAILDFRPLAPCVAKWGAEENNSVVCGVFVGSADDSFLRFYEPKENRLLLRSDLPKEHFQIDTPIMAIDFHSNGTRHILALAGQDGTIRIITWRSSGQQQEQTFQDISSHTVIVDGPLVCLQIQEQQDKNQLLIVIGSLCGYVCRLKCTLPTSSSSSPSSSSSSSLEWQGPTMVVQGLWNDLINDEDSVLSVHAFEDCIAIGTLAGKVLIYQASSYGDKYYKLWECVLPYSIHGLQVTLTGANTFDMVVVTRRSLHVFRPTNPVPIRHDKLKYSVSAAKAQLQSLLQSPQSLLPPDPDQESESSASPKCSIVKDPEDANEEMIAESVEDNSQKAVEPAERVDGVGLTSPSLQPDQTSTVDDGASSTHGTDVEEGFVLSQPPTEETSEGEMDPQPNESEMQHESPPPPVDQADDVDSQWVMVNDADGSLDESKPTT